MKTNQTYQERIDPALKPITATQPESDIRYDQITAWADAKVEEIIGLKPHHGDSITTLTAYLLTIINDPDNADWVRAIRSQIEKF